MFALILLSCTGSAVTQDPVITETILDVDFLITWADEGISLEIENTEEGSWWFGIAETTEEDPWQGEDCDEGDLLNNAIPILWCHPIEPAGSTLLFGGDPNDLQIGKETAIRPESINFEPMYYFFEVLTEQCFISGEGAPHYLRLCSNETEMIIRNELTSVEGNDTAVEEE